MSAAHRALVKVGSVLAALLVVVFAPCSFVAAASAQAISYDLATTSVLKVNLPASQAVTIEVSQPVGKIVVADPKIADAQPITDRSLYLVGKALGSTTVNLFDADGKPVGLIALQVGADTANMARSIRAAVPDSNVHVTTVNGRVLLSGEVTDADAMQKVLDVVHQYGTDDTAIVNTLTFKGGQQVNLQVRILEAQRNAGRDLGIQWGADAGAGNISTVGTGALPSHNAPFATIMASVLSGLTGTSLNLTLNALETKGLVRTLAEPNLTTLSGQSASFLAGGQVPVRVPDQNGNATLVYKDFGVKLVFTPVVLDNDRIQIRMTPEVSGISGYTASNDPIFKTRNLDATVELRDGQTFSVAGLLQNETDLTQNQLPWIGDVPVIGALFRSSSFAKNESELVVLVTPRLVQPNTPQQVAATPLDKTVPANDPEFFLLGQMEVTPQMIKNYETGAGVAGPYGYIIDLGDTKAK